MIKGKVCFITGTGRGIGKAIAEKFAEQGAIVYANSMENEKIDEWADKCSILYKTKVFPLNFNINDYAKAKEAVMQIKKEQGYLNVLVNNAGLGYNELIGMISIEKMKEIFDVNVFALTNLLQLAARVMTKQGFGSIINISSTVGLKGNPGQLAYAASKGAVIALTKSAAKELAPNKIRVNSIAPGLVDTEMFRMAQNQNMEDRISRIGMGRLAKPEEIANACVFLASDMSEYITGQIIAVDGSALI